MVWSHLWADSLRVKRGNHHGDLIHKIRPSGRVVGARTIPTPPLSGSSWPTYYQGKFTAKRKSPFPMVESYYYGKEEEYYYLLSLIIIIPLLLDSFSTVGGEGGSKGALSVLRIYSYFLWQTSQALKDQQIPPFLEKYRWEMNLDHKVGDYRGRREKWKTKWFARQELLEWWGNKAEGIPRGREKERETGNK